LCYKGTNGSADRGLHLRFAFGLLRKVEVLTHRAGISGVILMVSAAVLLVAVVAFVVGSMTSSVETEKQLPHLYR